MQPAGADRRARPVPSSCRCTGRSRPEEQDRALRPSERRKIILSTNIAETSLTIEGVRTVIDSGLARSVRFDPDRRHGPMVAGADQPGVGRTACGPRGTDRAGALHPALVGARDSGRLPAFERARDPPSRPERHRAGAALLGAERRRAIPMVRRRRARTAGGGRTVLVRPSGRSTGSRVGSRRMGRRILELPVHPRLARLLFAAVGLRPASREGAAVAALLSEKDIRAPRSAVNSANRDPNLGGRGELSDVLVRARSPGRGRVGPVRSLPAVPRDRSVRGSTGRPVPRRVDRGSAQSSRSRGSAGR